MNKSIHFLKNIYKNTDPKLLHIETQSYILNKHFITFYLSKNPEELSLVPKKY